MKKFLFLLLSLSLGLNAGLLYVRYMDVPMPGPEHAGNGRPGGLRPAPPVEDIIKQQLAAKTRHLNLDANQQEAIESILKKHLPATVAFKEKAGAANRKMAEVYGSVPFDKGAFQQLMRETSLARMRADSLSAVILAEEAPILTDEQRRLFAEEAPMSQGVGRRPPPPPHGR